MSVSISLLCNVVHLKEIPFQKKKKKIVEEEKKATTVIRIMDKTGLLLVLSVIHIVAIGTMLNSDGGNN